MKCSAPGIEEHSLLSLPFSRVSPMQDNSYCPACGAYSPRNCTGALLDNIAGVAGATHPNASLATTLFSFAYVLSCCSVPAQSTVPHSRHPCCCNSAVEGPSKTCTYLVVPGWSDCTAVQRDHAATAGLAKGSGAAHRCRCQARQRWTHLQVGRGVGEPSMGRCVSRF
jgi:hypothetical protein